MKKTLFMVLCALITFPMMASKPNKMWNFTINNDAEVIVEQSFATDKSATEALKAVKMALNHVDFEDRSTLEEKSGVSAEYELKKNTKSVYNPFAGNFQESMRFRFSVRYAKGHIIIKASEFTLTNRYQGFGSNTKSENFIAKIEEYKEYEAIVNNASTKNKDKKDALDEMEDIDDSLNKCQQELDAIFAAIKRVL